MIEARFAAQKRRRHAVHVTGQRRGRCVVIGMRIEPHHEQRPVLFLPVARDAVDRAHRQRMVAAHEDRQRAGACQRKSVLAEHADPALHLVIILRILRCRPVGNDGGAGDVTVILDGEFELFRAAARSLRCADADGPIRVPACDAPISMGTPSSAMRGLLMVASDIGWFLQGAEPTSPPYALKYAICVVVASSRPPGDHNSPCMSP